MAAPAPLLPIVIPPAPANNPAFDDDPVYLPGGHPLVTATSSFMSWQPVAAAAGAQAQQVSAPFHVLLYALGIRFKVSPLPADVAAARAMASIRGILNIQSLNDVICGTDSPHRRRQ